MTTTNTKARIAALNDAARTRFACRVVITSGIQALSEHDQQEVFRQVRSFISFNAANDPHSEHDFGRIEYNDEPIFWKIDYYDLRYEYGSEDPSDPKQTRRVLTIMLASEY